MITKRISHLAGLSLLAMLAGCATTKYQCPMPSGVACESAPSVYQATDAPGKAGIDAVVGPSSKKGIRAVPSTQAPVATTESGSVMPLPKPGDVIPIREQARVMRIWIAPWVDNAGNLNMASRVYSEIEAKRWAVGERAGGGQSNFYPLQVDPESPASPATSNSTVTPGAMTTASGTDGAMP